MVYIYIYVCIGIFIKGYVYILDFCFYLGSMYNIIATKRGINSKKIKKKTLI